MASTLLKKLCLLFALAPMLSGCTDDDDPMEITLRLNQTPINYSTGGVWEGVASETPWASQYMNFSHSGYIGPDGLEWQGFTPARVGVTDASDRFAIPSAGGLSGNGTPYVVACWNTQENPATPPSTRSCRITYGKSPTAARSFEPLSIYVQNTAYVCSQIQESDTDFLILEIHGVNADGSETMVETDLARGTALICDWKPVDLASLGQVKELYFTMRSSDNGEWGMKTPPYFAIDGLCLRAQLP